MNVGIILPLGLCLWRDRIGHIGCVGKLTANSIPMASGPSPEFEMELGQKFLPFLSSDPKGLSSGQQLATGTWHRHREEEGDGCPTCV